jgi:hypothetical protein
MWYDFTHDAVEHLRVSCKLEHGRSDFLQGVFHDAVLYFEGKTPCYSLLAVLQSTVVVVVLHHTSYQDLVHFPHSA